MDIRATDNIGFISIVKANKLAKEILIISFVVGSFLVFILYTTAVGYVFRNFSFKYYAVKRTNNLLDDIGFAITFCVLILLYSSSLQILFDNAWYKFLSVYVSQPFILYLLFKNKAYSYSINKRYQPLKT